MSSLHNIVHNEILPRVEKPSRYLGCEVNSVHKDPASVRFRFCLAFPDMCDLGLSNLGLLVLYHILNARADVWAERAYAPALDMEAELRARGLPLFSVESKTPLSEFDAVGFTLQYELAYTNILNMLELGGIPLLSAQRRPSDPIILAGGPCAFNPEPLADFIDAFAIGDGEELVLDLVDAIAETRGLPRVRRLERLAQIPGVYVPSLFPTTQLPDGTVVPAPGAPSVRRRVVANLDAAPFPTAYIVPFTEQAHDRASLEVLRGCTQSCRFCQAGMTYRPVRERSVETLVRLAKETLDNTGYEEVALSSLSTCDYSRVADLLRQTTAVASPLGAAVSLPSVRLDSFSLGLADMVRSVRKTGLTFAPEAATPRMRAIINKSISDEDLLACVGQVFQRGWDLVKLYFMIGLPGETDEDVLAIAELARKALQVGRQANRRARINLGVSTFVPKPHTPFQWERQISIQETERKQRLLGANLRDAALKFGRHDAAMSYLEGIFSRGDRRLGWVLLAAYKLGCRFDAWSERFSLERWQQAFAQVGLDPDAYLRARAISEPLPWDHIDTLVDRGFLVEEHRRAQALEVVRDCRYSKCHRCGVMDEEQSLCVEMLRRSRRAARQAPEAAGPTPQGQLPPGQAVQKLRFRLARVGPVRFLSHKETVNAFLRAVRRARVPICYSQGFHPHPKVSFSCALPVGMESTGEYGDILLHTRMEPDAFVSAMNATLPEGLRVLDAAEVPTSSAPLMSLAYTERYLVLVPNRLLACSDGHVPPADAARRLVDRFLSLPKAIVERVGKAGPRQIDVRPMVRQMEVVGAGDGGVEISAVLSEADGVKPRAYEVVGVLLGISVDEARCLLIRKVDSSADAPPVSV